MPDTFDRALGRSRCPLKVPDTFNRAQCGVGLGGWAGDGTSDFGVGVGGWVLRTGGGVVSLPVPTGVVVWVLGAGRSAPDGGGEGRSGTVVPLVPASAVPRCGPPSGTAVASPETHSAVSSSSRADMGLLLSGTASALRPAT